MAISAQEAQGIRFSEGRRGYDEREVDGFKDRVVQTLRAYEAELAKAADTIKAANARVSELEDAEEAVKRTFLAASRSKREIEEEARAEAEHLVSEAQRQAEEAVAAARAEAEQMRSAARAESDALVTEAREEAAHARDGAESEATRLLTDARRRAEEADEQTRAEQHRLQQRLAQLRTAVADIEQRLRAFADASLDEVAVVSGLIDLETEGIEQIPSFQGPELPDETGAAAAPAEGEGS